MANRLVSVLEKSFLSLADSRQSRVPARAGLPVRLSQMPAELVHPGFSVAIGMILYANRTRMKREAEKPSLLSKVRDVFAGNF